MPHARRLGGAGECRRHRKVDTCELLLRRLGGRAHTHEVESGRRVTRLLEARRESSAGRSRIIHLHEMLRHLWERIKLWNAPTAEDVDRDPRRGILAQGRDHLFPDRSTAAEHHGGGHGRRKRASNKDTKRTRWSSTSSSRARRVPLSTIVDSHPIHPSPPCPLALAAPLAKLDVTVTEDVSPSLFSLYALRNRVQTAAARRSRPRCLPSSGCPAEVARPAAASGPPTRPSRASGAGARLGAG
eukprot:scaffold110473_cov63-Phaeocystis_antarctica.AAC.2